MSINILQPAALSLSSMNFLALEPCILLFHGLQKSGFHPSDPLGGLRDSSCWKLRLQTADLVHRLYMQGNLEALNCHMSWQCAPNGHRALANGPLFPAMGTKSALQFFLDPGNGVWEWEESLDIGKNWDLSSIVKRRESCVGAIVGKLIGDMGSMGRISSQWDRSWVPDHCGWGQTTILDGQQGSLH